MTDPGGRCAYQAGRALAEPVRPVAGWPSRLMGRYRERLPAISERLCVPVACAPLRLRSPLKAPGLTVCGLQCFHGPDAELQHDKPAINVRLIYRPYGVACGQFQFSPHAQAAVGAFPGKGSVMGVARQRNPQHFHRARTATVPLRTSHPHVCAQPAGKQCSCPASPRQAGQLPGFA